MNKSIDGTNPQRFEDMYAWWSSLMLERAVRALLAGGRFRGLPGVQNHLQLHLSGRSFE